MMYEISKEAFKQRVENPLNFAFVNTSESIEGIESTEISSLKKDQNILIFSLDCQNREPSKLANKLESEGFEFVYFYEGSVEDKAFVLK